MMERRALGKGIDALIPDHESEKHNRMQNVHPDQIQANPFQPREEFEQEGMDELVKSIKEKGILQPILVRRKGDAFELIAGERRWRASKLLNLNEIPIIIKDVEDQDSLEISLIENIQRRDFNAIEEAKAYSYLLEKFNLTQEEVADILGKARATISNALRLLKLPLEIQDEIKKGRISFAHGRTLLEIDDPLDQRKLAEEIISRALSVRELENIVKIRRPRSAKRRMVNPLAIDPMVAVTEEELQQSLGTKVRVIRRKKRGHINIEFYSMQDLDRIAQLIKERKG